jgi:hypothetical protein
MNGNSDLKKTPLKTKKNSSIFEVFNYAEENFQMELIFAMHFRCQFCSFLSILKYSRFFQITPAVIELSFTKSSNFKMEMERGNDHLIEFHLTESVDRKFLII